LRIKTFPSLELVDSFTLPEHNRKTPRGVCPSTNNVASGGKRKIQKLEVRNTV
jgi:hypothetical protein